MSTQPTMADLLRLMPQDTLKIGQTIKGTILMVGKNQVIINVPNVGVGIVRNKEIYNEEYISRLKVGEEVESMILSLDNKMGMLELSFREIGRDKIWEEIKHIHENSVTVDAKIRDVNRGGFLVRVKGIDGFLPASLLAPNHAIKTQNGPESTVTNQLKKYLGQSFQVKVVSINPDTDSLIASEKAVSEEAMKLKLSKYRVGDIVEGDVIGVVDYGVFVRFDEALDGLVHISEIAWKKVEDPKQYYKIGDKVKVKITEIDNDFKINLSIKQITENPWILFIKSTKPGDKFVGRVNKIAAFGIIAVDEERDIQGLCHITQVSENPLENPTKIYDFAKVGELKEFTVLKMDGESKLYLTLIEDYNKAVDIQAKIESDMEAKRAENRDNKDSAQKRAPKFKKAENDSEEAISSKSTENKPEPSQADNTSVEKAESEDKDETKNEKAKKKTKSKED